MAASRFWLVSWIALALAIHGLAQNFPAYNFAYYNFTKADGLPEVNVNDFTQDKQGYMYAGTGSGLYRHNGNRWEQLKSPLNSPSESIDSYVNITQYNADEHLIYIISLNDVQIYDPSNGRFTRLIKNKVFHDAVKLSIFFDPKIEPLIATTNGIWMVKDKTITPWPISANLPNPTFKLIYNIIRIDDQHIGVCANNYFGIWDEKNNRFTSFKNETGIPNRKGVYDQKRHRIWFSSLPKLVYFDLNTYTFKIDQRSYFENECRDIVLYDDLLWISSGSYYDITKGVWTSIPYNDGRYTNAIQYWPSLFIDQEKNIWCGSQGFGANVLFNTNKWVRNVYYGNNKTNFEPLSHAVDGEDIYVSNGFNNMITKLNTRTGKTQSLNMPIAGPIYSLNLCENVLIGCNEQKVFGYDLKTKKSYPIPVEDRNKIGVLEYVQCFKDQIFIGNDKGFYIFQTKDSSTSFVDLTSQGLGYIRSSYVDTIDQNFYILGIQNIAKYEIKSRKLSYPFFDAKNQRLYIQNPVSLIRVGDYFWMTSSTEGLYKIHAHTFQHWQFNKEKNFLSSSFLNHLIAQNDLLWVGTIETLHLFDTKKERVIMSVDRQRGLNRDDTSYGLAKAGQYLIKLNYASIDIMDPRMMATIEPRRPIYITRHNTNERNKINIPFARDTTFFLTEKDANIEIEYLLPLYTNFQHHSFSYRMLGIDVHWQHTYDRLVRFNRLPVGNYVLEIKAWTSDGTMIDHVRKIGIVVKPLFFRTWWFMALIGLFLLGITYLIYKIRLDKVRTELSLKSKYEKQISVLEMKALRAQMNPHFIFNSLNSIQKFIFEKDEFAASQYLTKFSRLIRLILEHSNQEFITVSSELEMLKYYIDMERLRFSDKFTYRITKDDNIDDHWLIPSMVIQPHVENAIWHGLMHKDGDCQLWIQFENVGVDAIRVVIEDNGVGRTIAEQMKSKQSLRNKSFGSLISSERIKYFAVLTGKKASFEIQDLFYDDGTAAGTRIIMLLPINNTVVH